MRHFILIPVETASSGGGCLGPLFFLLIIFIALTNHCQSQQGQEKARDPEYERKLEEFNKEKKRLIKRRNNRKVAQAKPTDNDILVPNNGDKESVTVKVPKNWDTVYIVISSLGNVKEDGKFTNTVNVQAKVGNTLIDPDGHGGAGCKEVSSELNDNNSLKVTPVTPSNISSFTDYYLKKQNLSHAQPYFFSESCPF
ncbi:MAG: hypothetical protein ACLFM2_06650 [Halothece sp.]